MHSESVEKPLVVLPNALLGVNNGKVAFLTRTHAHPPLLLCCVPSVLPF
jgi:hypothetical protein